MHPTTVELRALFKTPRPILGPVAAAIAALGREGPGILGPLVRVVLQHAGEQAVAAAGRATLDVPDDLLRHLGTAEQLSDEELERVTVEVLHVLAAELGPIVEVFEERQRQDAKFGIQDHDPFLWSAILTEEVGEAAKAALHTRFGGPEAGLDKLRTELIQCAAVAVSAVQCLDRGDWDWGAHGVPVVPPPPKPITVYLAGGYQDRRMAGTVASLLEQRGVRIALAWWSSPALIGEPARARARAEAEAVKGADLLVALNVFARTGTATELGIALGAGVPVLWICCPDEEDARDLVDPRERLDWFGNALANQDGAELVRADVDRWHAGDIAAAICLHLDAGLGDLVRHRRGLR